MARARNLKPGFFTNEDLIELPFEYRILFAGLWTLADKEGRLEDRPKKIKLHVFPGDDVDCDAGLNALQEKGFVLRYSAGNARYIQILTWKKHQSPHAKEAASVIPAPEIPVQASEKPVPVPEIPVLVPLTPSSLTPSSLTPDSPFLGLRERDARDDAEKSGFVASLKTTYPDGTYRQSEWLLAEREIDWQFDNGYTEQQLRNGTERYARQVQAKGNVGTQFVLSPAKFFARGPQPKFLEPYPLPAVRAGPTARPAHVPSPTTAELEALEASRAN